MIRAHRYEDGQLTTTDGVGAVVMPDGDAKTWFHVFAPDAEERQALVERLDLHELAFNDAVRERHPPKIEDYGEHLFVISHTPMDEGPRPTRKVAIFLAERWILTVTMLPLDAVQKVEQWVVNECDRFLTKVERVAHALLDRQLDNFETLVDDCVDRVETLECGVADRAELSCLNQIQELRRDTSRLTRIVRAQRDVLQSLSRTSHPALSEEIRPYLRDLYDHCLRIYDHLDGMRESLSAARDGYLSAVNNRLSDTMKVLTVIATIMMPLSLVAGIFGMNFGWMPLLQNPIGFWVSMGMMALVAGGMLFWFRRRGWI